jgi:hypothetical protein
MTGYDYETIDKNRFIHYFQQIDRIRRLKPKNILIAGAGDHTISDFFSRQGVKVQTLDVDANLFPDYLCDIRDIDKIKEKFDIVVVSEVLEHLNFEHIPELLTKLSKIGKYILISVPYVYLRLIGQNCGKIRLFGNVFLISDNGYLKLRMPYFFWNPKKYPDSNYDIHKWSIGFKGYSRARFRKLLLRDYDILEEKIEFDTNCIFWVCQSSLPPDCH